MLRRAMMAQSAGGGGITAYRHHRIYVTAINGAGYLSMNEVQLRLTAGGADQTLPVGSGGATAASASYFADNGARAVDDFTGDSNAWVVTWSGGPEWWRYDAGAGNSIAVAELAIWPESSDSYQRAPRDFILQGSNDNSTSPTTWTDIKAFSSVTGWSSYGAGGGGIYRTFAVP